MEWLDFACLRIFNSELFEDQCLLSRKLSALAGDTELQNGTQLDDIKLLFRCPFLEYSIHRSLNLLIDI